MVTTVNNVNVTNWLSGNPVRPGLYQVNRGEKVGIWFKYWNGEFWGLAGENIDCAMAFAERKSPVQELPWRGLVSKAQVMQVAKVEVTPQEVKVRKVVKVDKADGTVFFRDDRQKWVAVMNGKQEAARNTKEACLSYLMKKYNIEGTVV